MGADAFPIDAMQLLPDGVSVFVDLSTWFCWVADPFLLTCRLPCHANSRSLRAAIPQRHVGIHEQLLLHRQADIAADPSCDRELHDRRAALRGIERCRVRPHGLGCPEEPVHGRGRRLRGRGLPHRRRGARLRERPHQLLLQRAEGVSPTDRRGQRLRGPGHGQRAAGLGERSHMEPDSGL